MKCLLAIKIIRKLQANLAKLPDVIVSERSLQLLISATPQDRSRVSYPRKLLTGQGEVRVVSAVNIE